MKILCNGFNLYGQLWASEYVIEKFTNISEANSIEDLMINHSFSVLKSDGNCKIVHKSSEVNISNCGKVVKICSNDERVVLLNDMGKVFKVNVPGNPTGQDISGILKTDASNEKIINISCGSKLTIAYTDKGNLYNIPNKLNFHNENIVDMQCGREHCILLDRIGNVYTFGRGSRGQLGHAQLDDEPEPVQVAALGGVKIIQIAAGGWHSCALSRDGDLYTWGWNGNGQLGLGVDGEARVSVMASPHVVDFPDPQSNGTKVACGNRHTIVLLGNNQLFGCGWNKYKQLTHFDIENYNSITYLHDLSGEEVVALKCGQWNSVVLCK